MTALKYQKTSKLSRLYFLVLIMLVSQAVFADLDKPRKGISYSYPEKYSDWEDAFLAGNGKMGIMVFGNPLNETVIFNDRGFNLAKSRDRSFNEVPKETLARIRQLCAEEKFKEANKLAVESSGWQGGGEGNRHPGFKMSILIPGDREVSDYIRECDYTTGEIFIKWKDGRGQWIRKAFVSRKDNVIVQEISAPSNGQLNCEIKLLIDPEMNFPDGMEFVAEAKGPYLLFKAKYPKGTNGAGYEGVTRFAVKGGSYSFVDGILNVSEAKSLLLLTRTQRYYRDCESSWNLNLLQESLSGFNADYSTLLARQKESHGKIYNRVKLDLEASQKNRSLSNEALLAMQGQSDNPVKALWERVFDAGRYHLLSSASDQTPPDLLGIWTGDCNAGWGGYYHLDANLNLQISSGNIGNMPEVMAGYFNLIDVWRKDFRLNAKKLLGCRGLLSCGNSPGLDSGLMANINDFYPYHYKTGEMGWLLYSLWEYYLVTGDKEFLRQRMYPYLIEMGTFYEDFLKLKDAKGNYIIAGSVSPENQASNIRVSLVNNSNYDISGARFLLSSLVHSSEILGVSEDLEKWQEILEKLPPYLINSEGALQEWAWPGFQDSYGHRHSSQLMMIWPYRQVTPENDPAIFKAAYNTLLKKDKHNYEDAGHGLLHAALIAAGLNNAESVNNKLLRLTGEGFYYSGLSTAHYVNRRTFCTDVCHSVPSIMMEMLVSSRPGTLELLPALPAELHKGAISGMKGRCRVTINNLSWDMSNKTVRCVLVSDIDQDINLIQRRGIDSIVSAAETVSSPIGSIARIIKLEKEIPIEITINLE